MKLIGGFFIILGLIFYTSGSVGILRFPDFYSRMHPAGKLDTAGLMATIIGLILYSINWHAEDFFTGIKLLLIVAFTFITSPTATHAIVDAGVRAGFEPWHRDKK